MKLKKDVNTGPLVAILAGSYAQFLEWEATHPYVRAVFCDEWPRFAGYEFSEIIEVGTFRQREDAAELWQMVVPMVRPSKLWAK